MDVWQQYFRHLEQNKLLMAVRQGMFLTVPLILTGSLALLLLSIPVQVYQEWLNSLSGGDIVRFLSAIHEATLGSVSLLILISVSLRYESLCQMPYMGIAPFVSVCSYLAFLYLGDTERLIPVFRSVWMFHAIVCALFSSMIFVWLQKRLPKGKRSYADGEDALFQYIISAVIPAAAVILGFAALNSLFIRLFGPSVFQTPYGDYEGKLFTALGRGFGSGLLFIFLIHFMWFFGIHGSNVLDNVARNVFNVGLELNMERIATGQAPTEIVSKSFFDTFVLFGGCGTLICLVLAVFLAGRLGNIRRLAKIGFFPVVFNMNELILFGVPVVLNPVYFIPFILTPIILTFTSYFATVLGLVPIVVHEVEWTTPIFLSGYAATGSPAGSVLQFVNLAVGIFIYIPFVRLDNKMHSLRTSSRIEELTEAMAEMEALGIRESLTGRSDSLSVTARGMAGNLQNAIDSGGVHIFYQPQVNEKGVIVGAEALLRWHYDTGQYIYPPLAVALAEETGQMEALGNFIIRQVCGDLEKLTRVFGDTLVLSVNLTADQITGGNVFPLIREELERRGLKGAQLGLELTEQTALQLSPKVIDSLETMRQFGNPIIMDDFGMGHSSMTYLRENRFDVVKLDGSVVKDILENKRSRDIISSIIYLSKSLDIEVIAEYVESEDQRQILEELECVRYQGYLFGKPEPFEVFIKRVAENRIKIPAEGI